VAINRFDQAARYCARLDPIGFLHWLVPGLDESMRFHGWLDTRTVPVPGAPDRTCDTVAELAQDSAGGPRWALLVEFQTEPEAEVLDRALEYAVRLRRALRFGTDQRGVYQVVAAVVGLTGPPQADRLDMALPGMDAPAHRFHAAVRTLRDEDAAATLERIASGTTARCLRCWISLMRGGTEPGIMERWKEIARDEPEGRLRADYAAIATLFAELTDCVPQWQKGLEGWDMRESTVVAEWMAEGIAQARRSDLLLVLEQKFATPVPPDLAVLIEAQADGEVLTHWLAAAVRAESLEAFRGAISRQGNGAG
jgi:hypothetical protein